MSNRQVIEQYWAAIAGGDLADAEACLHPDVVVSYPQSGEVFRGRDNYMAILRNYPGGLPASEAVGLEGDPRTVVTPSARPFGAPVVTVVGGDELMVGQSILHYSDGLTVHGVSIFRMRSRLIAAETTYFTEPFEAPEWRKQWADQPDQS